MKNKFLYVILAFLFCLCCFLITENVSALSNYPSYSTDNDRGTIISDFDILMDLVNTSDKVIMTSGSWIDGGLVSTNFESDLHEIIDRALWSGDWDYFFINYDPSVGLNEEGINRIRFFNSSISDTSITIYGNLQSWPANTFMLYTEPATEEYFKIYDVNRVEPGKWNTSSSGFRTSDGGLTGMSLLSTASNFDVFSAGPSHIEVVTRNEIFNVVVEPEPEPTPTPTPTPTPEPTPTPNYSEDIYNSITDSNVDSGSAGGFFNDFEDNDYGLSSVITAPLQFIQSLSSKTCTPLSVPIPFVNQNVTFPCMSSIYSQYFGSLFTLYQTITTGFIAYWVSVRIYALVKDFKNPDDDKIEVMDL